MTDQEFQLHPLTKLKYHFSNAEHEQILKYGKWAESLDEGTTIPNSERQDHFISVSRGLIDPETNFELLWLRYRLIFETDLLVVELENLLKAEQGQLKSLRKYLFDEVEKNKKESLRQAELIKRLQITVTGYERKLGLHALPEADISEKNKIREICSNCAGDGGAAGQCYKCDGSGWIFV